MTISVNGHGAECMCTRCLMADMDATIKANGLDPAAYGAEITTTAERTRYATPGAACGRGVVRTASDAQVRYIKRLLAERDTRNLTRLPGSEDVDNISLKGASDLIERLMACPEIPAAVAAADKPSKAQVDFAASLAERKGLAADRTHFEAMGRRAISKAIDMMKAMADAPKPAAEAVTEGMYRTPDGMIYKVQRAVHGSGNLYAKLLVVEGAGSASFEYAAGGIRKLRAEHRMTLEQAKEFGALYGVCCVCSATLTNEASIEAGIGPICAGKL